MGIVSKFLALVNRMDGEKGSSSAYKLEKGKTDIDLLVSKVQMPAKWVLIRSNTPTMPGPFPSLIAVQKE